MYPNVRQPNPMIDRLENRCLLSSSVSGVVFFDQNANGLSDRSPTAPPAVVYLDVNNNSRRDATERSTRVSKTGQYRFDNVATGVVRVRAELSMLFAQTLPTLGSGARIDIQNNKNYSNRNFGFRQLPSGVVTGTVFNDTNNNGTRDSGENPLAGVRVVADLNRDGLIGAADQISSYTSSTGFYSLTVPAGNVRVLADLRQINRRVDQPYVATRPGPTGMALAVTQNATVRRNFGALVRPPLDATTRPVIAGDDAPRADQYTLSFEDTFDGTTLDSSKWSLFEPGPRRDAIITQDAVEVANGELTIRTYTEGGVDYNAILSSQNKFQQKYGYFEARIAFNSAPGMWSAFWLLSNDMREGGRAELNPGRADLYGTEIDIVEHRSQNFWTSDFRDRITAVVHMDGYLDNRKSMENTTPSGSITSGYHTYGVDWRADEMRFYLDGTLWWTVNQQTSNNAGINSNPISGIEQFMLLSSEAQSGAWAGAIPEQGYGSRQISTTTMKVDYVRVFVRN